MRRYSKQYKWHVLVLILTITSLTITAYAQTTLKGSVMRVSDGDTAVIQPEEGGQFIKCRLYGIDAPETSKKGKHGQPYGEKASKELKGLILGQTVDVTLTGQKTYNREVCLIKKNGLDVNLEMVKRGYAWAYVHYLKRPYASQYIDAEKKC